MLVPSATAPARPIVVHRCCVCGRESATYAGAIPRRWVSVSGKLYCRNPWATRCEPPVVAKGKA